MITTRFLLLSSLLLFTALIAGSVGTAGAQSQSVLSQDELFLSRVSSDQRLPAVRLGLDEGLSQSSIYAMHQDQQGFMWFGTQAGLNKYDGYSFAVYKNEPGNPSSISHSTVYLIHEDSTGHLWLATNDGGLNRFDPVTEQFTRYLPNPEDSTSFTGSGVSFIQETRDGTLWIGTNNGLNRYNPEADNFIRYHHDPEDSTTLSTNTMVFLHEDAAGLLWLVTFGGGGFLDRLNPETGRVTRFRHDPEDAQSLSPGAISVWNWDDTFVSFFEDSKGRLWAGTLAGGLNRFDPETERFTRYMHDPEQPMILGEEGLAQIHEDQAGRLWVVTWGSGLNRYDPETDRFIRYEHRAQDPRWSHQIVKMYEDRSGLFWSITVTEDTRGVEQDLIGLERFDPETGRFTHFDPNPDDPALPNIPIGDILGEDDAGQLWLKGNSGMDRYDPDTGTFTLYAHNPDDPRSIIRNQVFKLYEDRTGMLWFGGGGGISKIDPRPPKFSHIRHDPKDPGSLGSPNMWDFLEDREGVLWVGTNQGLDRYDPATGDFLHYQHVPVRRNLTSGSNPVSAIMEDRDGQIWVGTALGLYHFDRVAETFTLIHLNPPEEDNYFHVIHLYEDRAGLVWVGTSRGLYRQEQESGGFTHFHHNPEDSTSLSDDGVVFIHEGTSNHLWIGTNGGLNRFDRDSETFTVFRHDPDDPTSLSSDNIQAIYGVPDDPNVLWVGTSGGGLNRFDIPSGTAKRYTEANSDVPDNVVYTILSDEGGYLWLSTNNGLARFDPRTETFKTYDTDDGLQSKEFNGGAAYKASNGAMFFGGINGFNVFYPDQVQDDPTAPQIALTSLHVYNASNDTGSNHGVRQEADEALILPHNENDLTFEYAALHYARPEKNQYRYRLDPYEATWSEPSSQRQARYANLNPGTYTFQLQASNSDGVWTEEGLTFAFEVRPPWWQTTWAYLLYAMLFAVGLFTTDRVQRRRLLRKEQERARIERAELEAKAAEAQARALQAENERKEVELEKAKELEYAFSALQQAHEDLKTTQDHLIHAEKMASLGQMTAGIAHEIKNPLNFVNNFSDLNAELAEEVIEGLEAGEDKAELLAILNDLKRNAQTINRHGKRADSIVLAMMQHASGGAGERIAIDLNALIEEHITLAWHGKRTQVPNLQAEIVRDFGNIVGTVKVVPQEIGRVLLNLLGNAFDAVHEKAQSINGAYTPTVTVSTQEGDGQVEIRVSDNGPGISEDIKAKIFEPFFTTKPTGQGNTGLGLSLSYDIITQGHGGTLTVESTEGEGTTFIVSISQL